MVTLQSGRIHMFLKLFSCLFVIEKSCWFHNYFHDYFMIIFFL